jgi:filamentous hemagglutinin family protein
MSKVINGVNKTEGVTKRLPKTQKRSIITKPSRLPKIAALSLACCLALDAPLIAAPTGGAVVKGSANISQNGSVTNVNQNSQNVSINWQGFSIGANETVNFVQPNSQSIALNRVIGNEHSVISGALNANGKVFLINSNGVLFAKGSSVNVGGLVASALNISDDDFEKGNFVFKNSNGASGSVINLGKITADNGYVALLGSTVVNQGVIVADRGTVSLNSGNRITLNFNGNSLLSVSIDEGALNALVENKGAIIADGGKAILTAKAADDLLNAQVNNSGVIEAKTLGDLKGEILIFAHNGTANIDGTLNASAPISGDGGFIETSGDIVKIADSAVITTKAANGKTGTYLIDPKDFTIAAEGGDITGKLLGILLNANNVTLESAMGGKDGAGNINVNDKVTWNADSILTLNAQKDINVNASITAAGANAGLNLIFGGDYYILTKATFSGVAEPVAQPEAGVPGAGDLSAKVDTVAQSGGEYASINLSGVNASLKINGSEYVLIHSLSDLQNVNLDTAKNYALAQNIDLSGHTFNKALIDNFSGTFAGLGHTIDNLKINATAANVGLFAQNSGTLRDVGLRNVDIKSTASYVGALVGNSLGGKISYSYATGDIEAYGGAGGLVGRGDYLNLYNVIDHSFSNVNVKGVSYLGSLAGTFNGEIRNSHATGDVTGTGYKSPMSGGAISVANATGAGGLVGKGGGVIDAVYATGSVTQNGETENEGAGGLFGYFSSYNLDRRLTNSFATGKVIGQTDVGGLIGSGGGDIQNVYATGEVISRGGGSISLYFHGKVGGLIGNFENGTLKYSHATGNVTVGEKIVNEDGSTTVVGVKTDHVGGLIGSMNNASLEYVYATGNVTDNAEAGRLNHSRNYGGLVGSAGANSHISKSYATGDVSADLNVGGLVGNFAEGSIKDSYSLGAVSGDSSVGGLVGLVSDYYSEVTIENSYWDIEKSGQSEGVGVYGTYKEDRAIDLKGLNSDQLDDSGVTDSIISGGDTEQAVADYERRKEETRIQQEQEEAAKLQEQKRIAELKDRVSIVSQNTAVAQTSPSIDDDGSTQQESLDSALAPLYSSAYSSAIRNAIIDGAIYQIQNEDEQ